VIAGIWPLTSFRNAEVMNNKVPGISVPPTVMERMRRADAGERARLEGLKIAQETLREIRSQVQGVQIAAPFGRYALAVEVAQALGGDRPPASARQP
jgi:homocysteine S-methyltransferase